MKFIINESKFRRIAYKHILDKLNSLKLSPEEEDDDGSGVFRVNFDDSSEIEPGFGAFNYDYDNEILEVSPSIIRFCDLFLGLDGVGDYGIIAKWFEIKYGVDVADVWEWYDGAP